MIKMLSAQDQLEIIEHKMKKPRQYTNADLATLYGVSTRSISRINIDDKAALIVLAADEAAQAELEVDDTTGAHVFTEPGNYNVSMTVKSADGDLIESSTVPVNVEKTLEEQVEEINWNDDDEVTFLASNEAININTPIGAVVVNKNTAQYKQVFELLLKGEIKEAYLMANTKKQIEFFSRGNVLYKDGQLTHKGYPIHNVLGRRVTEAIRNGENVTDKLVNFLENLMENPSNKAVNELYGFLEHNDIEITDDGYFEAWKYVNSDFTDCKTGTFDNSPGKSPSMPRNQVDEDSTEPCSTGLHVCAKRYLGTFGLGKKLIKVKVHPRDVVCVPKDYNNSKMRTCQYTVIREASREEL